MPLVHLSDQESDSITHLRAWDKEQWRFVVRAKALHFVAWEGQRARLDEIADHLNWRPSGAVQLTAGVIVQQLLALDAAVTAELIAEWYYWQWMIESYFKLCKSAGQHLEDWQQETAAAMAKRLLIAAMAGVVTIGASTKSLKTIEG